VNFCYTWATLLCWSQVGEYLFHVCYSVSGGEFCCTWATPECSLGNKFNLLDSVEVVIWIFLLLSYCHDYVSSRLSILYLAEYYLLTLVCLLLVFIWFSGTQNSDMHGRE
jgi:hypothetical protein